MSDERTGDAQNRVQWVYAAGDREELARRYDRWAKDYDAELERDFAWNGHVLAVDAFAKYVETGARVIDVGCGTGLAGVELARRGFTAIDGFDLSEGMLEESRRRGIYGDLRRGVLGEPLDYATDAYDAAIATGVFTAGHAPASGWDEVVRIVRPGGVFALTIRPDVFETDGFREREEALVAAGRLALLEVTEPSQMLAKGEPEIEHVVRVYRVTA